MLASPRGEVRFKASDSMPGRLAPAPWRGFWRLAFLPPYSASKPPRSRRALHILTPGLANGAARASSKMGSNMGRSGTSGMKLLRISHVN